MSETLVTIQLATLNQFSSTDLIRNGLHVSFGPANVPVELVTLLTTACRVRRPSSPTSYISQDLPPLSNVVAMVDHGNTLKIFGDDPDVYPVRTLAELAHYQRADYFASRWSTVLAVPPSKIFQSGRVAGTFNTTVLDFFFFDYPGELEFISDTAYSVDFKLCHPGGDPAKYSAGMKGDFVIRTCDYEIPFIFGKVDSNCDLDDKFRMLLLVHSFMRLCHSAAPSLDPHPLAIFLNQELVAEVHVFFFAATIDDGSDIRCHRLDYDLKLSDRLAHFILFLRNYADETKSLWSNQEGLRRLINDIRMVLQPLAPYSAVRKPSSVGRGTGLDDHLEEEDDDDDDEPTDGLGRMDWEVVNSDTPSVTWQRLLTGCRAILVQKSGKVVLVAKLIGEEEWTVLKRLQGVTGVVPITRHDVLPDGNSHIILMPWVGCSIDCYLYFTKNPTPSSRLVALSFIRALSRIHARRIAHLDLKPSNVRVEIDKDADGMVNIIDFGHSAILDNDTSFIEGEAGTRGWSAPEVLSGEPYDALLADIWSAGGILVRYAYGPSNRADRWLESLGREMQADEPMHRPTLSKVIRTLEVDADERERVSISP